MVNPEEREGEVLVAKRYFAPVWDCPVCGDTNEECGVDDIVGETLECLCGAKVLIEGD